MRAHSAMASRAATSSSALCEPWKKRCVKGIVQPRNHARRIAKGRMGGDIFDALAIDPDFTAVAQAFEVLVARQWSRRWHCLNRHINVLPAPWLVVPIRRRIE